MKLWGEHPGLAVFPGTLILDDGRPGDHDYPSSSLTQAQLSAEEPALSGIACQAGARLYLQEGMLLLCACMQASAVTHSCKAVSTESASCKGCNHLLFGLVNMCEETT